MEGFSFFLFLVEYLYMITLTTTIHDPHMGLKWISDLHIKELQELFDNFIIVSSPFTADEYLNELNELGIKVIKRKDNKIGKTYFEAVKQGYKTKADYIFYCDFDRILHWVHSYPTELKRFIKFLRDQTIQKKRIDYIVCERTPEGYKKHHEALYETEQLPNKVISKKIGEKNFHDFLSGCFVFSHKAVTSAIEHEGSSGYQFFGEWPLMFKQKKVNILYKQFKGLEWETPNQNREAVEKAGGVEKWREILSTPEEWKKRVKMAREIVETIL